MKSKNKITTRAVTNLPTFLNLLKTTNHEEATNFRT